MLVNVKVRHVLSDGLLVSFLTFFNGTIDCFHMHQVRSRGFASHPLTRPPCPHAWHPWCLVMMRKFCAHVCNVMHKKLHAPVWWENHGLRVNLHLSVTCLMRSKHRKAS